MVYPFFLQYSVRPSSKNGNHPLLAAGISTVIVFAETDELARARASRYLARQGWEITEVMRAMLIQQHHVEHMDGELKSIYQQAEQQGIGAMVDGLKKGG